MCACDGVAPAPLPLPLLSPFLRGGRVPAQRARGAGGYWLEVSGW